MISTRYGIILVTLCLAAGCSEPEHTQVRSDGGVDPCMGHDHDGGACDDRDSGMGACEGTHEAGGTCSPGCLCEPAGTSLLIQVLTLDGQPIRSAAVTAGNMPRPTDGVGRILLENLPADRVPVRVEAPGFAPASIAVNLAAGTHAGTEIRLRPQGARIPFQAETGATIEQPGARIAIPPGALVSYQGQPVTGTVEATVVLVDPSQAIPDRLPGPLQGHAAVTGDVVELESVVMAEVRLWQGGLPVQLAPGARARLELAVPDAMAEEYEIGAVIPAWWLDLDVGMWREEGAGTIVVSSNELGKLVWEVEVAHFTWWTGSRAWADKHCVTITVEDTFGNPIPDLRASAQGVSYEGSSLSSYTDGNGQACVEIMHDASADILVGPVSMPLATRRVADAGPAADCAGSGAECVPVTLTLRAGTVICTPGTFESCSYGGPPGTEAVGVCQIGRNLCNTEGTGWSGCLGEVLPVAEACDSPFDEDCDGASDEGLDCGDCSLGQQIACYSGPPAAMDVGMCQAGTRTCSLSRMFGPCIGEVLPQPETCETAGDDDCDGSTSCAGKTLWSRRFGEAGRDYGFGIVVDSAGDVLLTGSFEGPVDFGGGPSTSDGIFVVKLNAQGQHLWSRGFASLTDHGYDIAVDGAGNILLTGSFEGTLSLGGGGLITEGLADIFAVKLDAQGQHLWSRRFGGAGRDLGVGIAVDSAGNVLLTGEFQGTVNFGGDPLSSIHPSDTFVVKLNAQGQHLWSHHLGTSGEAGRSVGVDSADNVLLTGAFEGTVDFGGGPLSSGSSEDVFVVKLDAQGQHLWSRGFGGTSDAAGYDVAVDGAGNVLLTGEFQGTIDFGAGPLSSAGIDDIFAVKLDAQGQHLWSLRFGTNDGFEYIRQIRVDNIGNILLVGAFFGTVELGGGPISSVDGSDIFAVKLDARGQHLWSQRFGGTGNDAGFGIAADGTGNVLLTGVLDTADLSVPSSGPGESDIFTLKLNP